MAQQKIDKPDLDRLRPLERSLKLACLQRDIPAAEATLKKIHATLSRYGAKCPRLLEARLWYFECLLDSDHVAVAESGFVGIRGKATVGTRLHLESTLLLGVSLLRQKKIEKAKEHFKTVFTGLNQIQSASSRRVFQKRMMERIEEESILTELIGVNEGALDPEKINAGAIILVKKSEDEIYEALAKALPGAAVYLFQDIRNSAIGDISKADRLLLPPPKQAEAPINLGRRVGAILKKVAWRTVCNAESPIYQMWSSKLPAVYGAAYFATAVQQAMSDLKIGIPMLATGLVAILMKSSAAEFCEWAKPEPIMKTRRKGESKKKTK